MVEMKEFDESALESNASVSDACADAPPESIAESVEAEAEVEPLPESTAEPAMEPATEPGAESGTEPSAEEPTAEPSTRSTDEIAESQPIEISQQAESEATEKIPISSDPVVRQTDSLALELAELELAQESYA